MDGLHRRHHLDALPYLFLSQKLENVLPSFLRLLKRSGLSPYGTPLAELFPSRPSARSVSPPSRQSRRRAAQP